MTDTTRPAPSEPTWSSLAPLLGELLGSHSVAVRPLGGGLTNVNFRVDVGGQSYVFRISDTAASEQLGIGRVSELACAQAAAEAGVGPEIVYSSEDKTILVARFIQGRQVTDDEARDPAFLARIAQTLRAYHRYRPRTEPNRFCAFAVIQKYIHRAMNLREVDNRIDLPAEMKGVGDWLEDIQKQPSSRVPCLCHNDLLAANFIDEGDALRVIDWEYAGWGDPFFDLGNFAANSQLGEDQEQALLKGYLGKPPSEEEIRRLREMRRVSDLREAAWSFLQATTRRKEEWPTDYMERGRKYLGRWRAAHTTSRAETPPTAAG